jgi:hypothetical protein
MISSPMISPWHKQQWIVIQSLVGQNTFLLKNCFVDITPWTIKAKDIFKGKNILIFLCYDYYISYKLQIFSGRKTDFKFRRFRVRTPLMFLIIKIYYKYSLIIKIFPTLEYQLRLMTWEWIGTHIHTASRTGSGLD